MRIEFDAEKDEINQQKHGVSLAESARFEFSTAHVFLDDRKEYGEKRFRAFGFIDDRLHVLAFTVRKDTVRAISLRKGNPREVKRYGIRR